MIPCILLIIGSLATSLSGGAVVLLQELPGTWIGQWDREGAILDVEVAFTRTAAGYEGSFSSAQLRVVGVPFERIRYEAPRVSWALVGDATTSVFEGTVNGDALEGQFREEQAVGTFRLARRKSAAVAIQEEEISFHNGSVTLSGTLVRPAGSGPFPGVVFLHGSGPEGRWGSRYLANAFAQNGIAALVYDKRGVGASTGDWRQVGFVELVGDAVAAVEALRASAGIDSARVGIHGHSQGGTIAPWVADESPALAFLIASAASGVSMAEAESYSLGNAIGMLSLPEAERPLAERFVQAIVRTAYDGAAPAELESAWQAVRNRPWAFEPPPESDFYWAFSRRIASYRPLDHWRRVAAPTLLVYGEGDERVPARTSAARIAEAYLGARGTRLDVLFFPGADHTFRLRPSNTAKFEWPRSAPGYPEDVIQWILTVTRTQPGVVGEGAPSTAIPPADTETP